MKSVKRMWGVDAVACSMYMVAVGRKGVCVGGGVGGIFCRKGRKKGWNVVGLVGSCEGGLGLG